MLVACWSVKGGVGVSTVVAGLAAASVERAPGSVLIADLCGDQALLHGVGPGGPSGLREWTRAGHDVPSDALERLEEAIDDGRRLVPSGTGRWDASRGGALAERLAADSRLVVADVARLVHHEVGRAVVEAAERSVLVVRACPLSMRAVADLPSRPDAVVVVRDPRRCLRWTEIAARCGAPVVAELDLDPSVGACADVGVVAKPLPRRFVRALDGVR